MRASLVLRELRISFEELLEYGRLLETDLSDPKLEISEETFQQIKELANHKETRQRIQEEAIRIIAKKLGAFPEHNLYYKIPAEIKWFGDRSNGGDYGFLKIPELGDVYFHMKHVSGLSHEELGPEVCVIAEIPKKDFEVKFKKSASKIYPIKKEEDIMFMLYCFLIYDESALKNLVSTDLLGTFRNNLERLESEINHGHISYFTDSILKKIEDSSLQSEFVLQLESLFPVLGTFSPEEEKKEEIDRITKEYLFNRKYYYPLFRFIIRFRKYCGLEITEEINKRILDVSYENHLYDWWKDFGLKVPFSSLVDVLMERLLKDPLESSEFLSKLKPVEIEILFEESFQKIIQDDEIDENVIAGFLNQAEEYDQEFNLELLGEKRIYGLWKNGIISKAPLNHIRFQLQKSEKEDYDNYTWPRREKIKTEKEQILEKISFQELKDLVSLIYYDENKKSDSKRFDEFANILNILKNTAGEKKTLVEIAFNNSSEWERLKLFVADYTDVIDFDNAVLYTGLLDSTSQKLFFKKVLKLIEDEEINAGLEDLRRITSIDYETSEYAREIDGVGLDFSLAVILQLLNDLKDNKITKTKTIYDLVASQIKRPGDLLVIDGFFDRCQGRTILKYDSETDEYQTERSYDRAPRFSTFCDGRKAINKATGEAAKCKKSGKEFWWCENDQCFEISRKQHLAEDYKNYNLIDFMRILGISYQEEQYEKLLGVINRVNRFLSHMTCRSCKTILRPVDSNKNSNYAFYRVTRFQCSNQECEESHKEIYLSHCLNGQCMNVIDSRDSVKCKTSGYTENCGWYICNNCFACCSSEKLKGRQYALEITGQEYQCHTEGHKDRGILCCNKCGEEMGEEKLYGDLYKQQLNWFIKQRNSHKNITSYGKRKDNKWWFIWEQGDFTFEEYRKHLENLYKTGFNIPDYRLTWKTNQLIGEPFNENNASQIFSCNNCDNIYKLSDFHEFDYARQNSIFNYHDKIFNKTRVK